MTDHELELLELQLIATKSSHHYLTAPNNLFPTYPRKHRGTSSLMTLWANRYLLDEGPNETTKKLLKGIHTYKAIIQHALCTYFNIKKHNIDIH